MPRRNTADDPGRFHSRRNMLKSAAGALAGAALLSHAAVGDEKPGGKESRAAAREGKAVKHGRIKQSVVQWCFGEHWDVPKTIEIAASLGCESVELIAPEHFKTLEQHGLTCAIATIDMSPDPPFVKGFNNPRYHAQVIKATKRAIDAAAAFGVKRVICFTGFDLTDVDDHASRAMSREEGLKNCVAGFKQVVGHAEKNGITLCLEILNTRADSYPDRPESPSAEAYYEASRTAKMMKGHPHYQGDKTDYCIDVIKAVGSPSLKLLFDTYHVQIMDGDIIRRIHQHKDYLGHIHTAGNPGRRELDDDQEINYKPIMQALLDVGYEGYVGQEFIPTGDPLAGLRQAVELCDV